jgi:hypothetical protein
MCYDDGGTAGTYTELACPDPAPPIELADERFDCNGDTYFHPAPPNGNPLSSAQTWHLGRPANEGFATTSSAAPPALRSAQARGDARGTVMRVSWPMTRDPRVRSYEVAVRRRGTQQWTWHRVATSPALIPTPLGAALEVAVGAVAADGSIGVRARTTWSSGRLDTAAPAKPRLVLRERRGSSTRFIIEPSLDNVRVTTYELAVREQSGRWSVLRRITPPAGGAALEASLSGAAVSRIRARDAAGNWSIPLELRTR